LSEKALAQGLGRPAWLSLSHAIEAKRNDYYDALQQTQRGNEITAWITWFVTIALEAQVQAEEHIDFTLRKTRLFDRLKSHSTNVRYGFFSECWKKVPRGSRAA
jgi:Fic family protein